MDTNSQNRPPISGSVPFIHNIDNGPAYWWLDILWVILATGDDTGGRYSLIYELLPKGSGPGPHKHTWSDETYYMHVNSEKKDQSESLPKLISKDSGVDVNHQANIRAIGSV